MATFQEYAQQFASHLSAPPGASTSGMLPGLHALIDAFPSYGNHDFQVAHRGALANLLEVNLPNEAIIPQSPEGSVGFTSISYNGPFSGYRHAFYGGVSLSPAASNLAAEVRTVAGVWSNDYWGKYGVAALTDAVRQTVGGNVDTGKLSNDLASYNRQLLPALSASYYAVFSHDFGPTAQALNALKASGQTAQANTELVGRISAGQFTANINLAISMGGDSTAAAVWFLCGIL